MVKFVDLKEEEDDGHDNIRRQPSTKTPLALGPDDRPNPNFSLPSAAALSCYPIISQLASYVDLNTLHELSRTCRQFRANLLEFRTNLIDHTLCCANEAAGPGLRLGNALNASYQQWTTTHARDGTKIDRIASGKVGACARDMVGDCRRCGRTVCRNCVVKRPQEKVIADRHRRLCRVCMKCPLDRLLVKSMPPRVGSGSPDREFGRSPCTCRESPWICQPCGQYLRSNDTTYMRGWAWRTRYSMCGGMGAGLGEGNEGVECGRGGQCLDSNPVVREVECDAHELAALEGGDAVSAEQSAKRWVGSSYTTCEIVGIGGNLKTKLKKMVRVGAIVKEYEDERAACRGFLRREQEGVNRSWCSWCDRVIPGRKDVDGAAARSTDSIASSSSSASSP